MIRKCCSNCFSDKALKLQINSIGRISRCHYCGTNDASTINIDQLYILISPLIEVIDNLFEEDNDGYSLFQILSTEFKLFNINTHEEIIEHALQHRQDLAHKKYKSFPTDTQNQWEAFKYELKHNNRFFPQIEIYRDAFLESGNLFEKFTEVIEQLNYDITTSDTLFRARISDNTLYHPDMKKPPLDKVTIGRANPDGISYLYTAEQLETALTEVRPSNGQTVYIACLKVKQDINVINLCDPKKDISFISLSSTDDFHKIMKLVNLLDAFAKELSLPVLPNRSHLDYIPTQFITEFFKNLGGIDGLMFNSSFGNGYNLVIFDQDKIDIPHDVPIKHLKIMGMQPNFTEL
ncbi:RES family NAD+ phosphorylase [Acinetobacter dispersus]|uniref:RES family NAD+ phosphorylase n=1 Tax=Acinetobacter dispersus TaxID=70348 RepID=UPI001F4A800C|nr:RES family NAD+ phosphorylase [Acinetobacter dispersus]